MRNYVTLLLRSTQQDVAKRVYQDDKHGSQSDITELMRSFTWQPRWFALLGFASLIGFYTFTTKSHRRLGPVAFLISIR